jgi:flagellar biosynthesis protein FlhG
MAQINRFTRRVRFVGVASAKGGVGQSTISLDWSRALARRGQPTLLTEIAGGDLAWIAGVTPAHFTEDVGAGTCSPAEAAVIVESNLDLLGTGNDWAVHGCDDEGRLGNLVRAIGAGTWRECIVDLGHTSPQRMRPIWEACEVIALIVDDDLSCVSRSYALIRRLLELKWGDRLALVFNHLADSVQVESLRQRFDQITRTFLGRTLPLIGVVPDAVESRRTIAVGKWVPVTSEQPQAETDIADTEIRTIKPALVADRKA